ncbi:hypothetical protein LJ739_14135 [Aestuariibacter halophilus]|uniref:Uncharacterized protein n=1 Tax=Fluctibacter halophilus TaxID=226011 RepID=A0ABS8G9X5_9ALTE|nr:hypothetical protein [Aestuariibacter halophilus]MCC2617387.1 hypothetical protein [Aestuariibacter halophilus]
MNRTFKYISSAACAGVLSAALVFQVSGLDASARCGCDGSVSYDNRLPASHPANRCALAASEEVSWVSWMSGRASNYQFHYLDLLELLTRSSDDQATPTPSQPSTGN